MKATGIIRRIDNLGRIVIPKEIRKKLKICEGENLEIYIDEEQIILQRYSNIKSIDNISQKLTESIYSILKDTVVITDTESIIAVSGKNKKELLNKKISSELFNIIKSRNSSIFHNLELVNDKYIEGNCKINFITNNGDVNGTLILISNEITKEKEQILDVNTTFLNKYLEE